MPRMPSRKEQEEAVRQRTEARLAKKPCARCGWTKQKHAPAGGRITVKLHGSSASLNCPGYQEAKS